MEQCETGPSLPCKRQATRPKRTVKKVRKLTHSKHSILSFLPEYSSRRVRVHSEALLVMNFHAHLCYNEVIGWLAGTYGDGVLDIQAAFPVKEQARETNPRINVEMDPDAAFAAQEEIAAAGLQIVGWYHSHPTFDNSPSIIDIENQTMYQSASQDGFVAGIISPFFLKDSAKSAFNLFEVVDDTDYIDEFGCQAPQLIPYEEEIVVVKERTLQVCEELTTQYSDNGRKLVLTRRWGKDSTCRHKIEQFLEGFLVSGEDVVRLVGLLNEKFR